MNQTQTKGDYKQLATEARKKVLQLVYQGQTSHIASNFSVIDIATVLYENLNENDQVVWSKGWAAATIYYFLNKQGKITDEQLNSFPQAPYLGLAETTVNGVLCNAGSVGHGLPIAVGMAYAKKLSGDAGKVYCIMSDGELNEGSVWEAVMLAAHLKLDNLVAIVDKNGWQAMGKTDEVINMNPIWQKFAAFSWWATDIDGHNMIAFDSFLKEWKANEKTMVGELNPKCPRAIIAHTIKGKGVSFFEDSLTYHYRHITDEDFKKAMEELNNA